MNNWDDSIGILRRALTVTGLVLYCLMILVVGLQMMTRWILGPYLDLFWTWTSELSEFLLVFVTFVGAGIVSRDREHISLEFLIQRAPRPVLRIIAGVQLLLIAWFLIVLIQGAVPLFWQNQDIRLGTLPRQPPFTQGWLYGGLLVGVMLMLAFTVRDAVQLVVSPDKYLEDLEEEVVGEVDEEAVGDVVDEVVDP
jgi:TRAP-type C4-dicarboxylate transport system permease small subunit